LIVASDTSPPSHFIRKISARLGAKIFYPRKSLSQFEKRRIGAGFVNPHIRDAYSAAIKALRRYSNRFRQIDAMGREDSDELKKIAISGKRVMEEIRK
jgi:predicted RNase H-like nuclease (RuvC/YqgF family)